MKLKNDRRFIYLALGFSLATLVLIFVGLVSPIKVNNAFAATIVLQFGIPSLWILTKWGAFKGMFRNSRKILKAKREKFRSEHNLKQDKKNKAKQEPLGYTGPLLMFAIGALETIIYLIYIFA